MLFFLNTPFLKINLCNFYRSIMFHIPQNCSWVVRAQTKSISVLQYRGADKSLARPGRKQSRKHVRDASDFNNIETRAFIKPPPPQGKAPKEIHAVLTETLACFLPGQAKDLSAPLYLPPLELYTIVVNDNNRTLTFSVLTY